jgi:hypothetical protein
MPDPRSVSLSLEKPSSGTKIGLIFLTLTEGSRGKLVITTRCNVIKNGEHFMHSKANMLVVLVRYVAAPHLYLGDLLTKTLRNSISTILV